MSNEPEAYLEPSQRSMKESFCENSSIVDVVLSSSKYASVKPDVVACTCNPAILEAEFPNGVGSVPVGDNSPSIGEWIV